MLIYGEFKSIEELSSGREHYPNYHSQEDDDSVDDDSDDDSFLED